MFRVKPPCQTQDHIVPDLQYNWIPIRKVQNGLKKKYSN